jgi:YgiT-type zinc finger domain-containing protein
MRATSVYPFYIRSHPVASRRDSRYTFVVIDDFLVKREKPDVCGSAETREELVSEVFQIDGQPVLVERIPARVCVRCGEPTFSREATERVRQLVQGNAQPVKSVQMSVLAYS